MRYLSLLFLILTYSSSMMAQTNRPILISQASSTRAIAFDSPSFRVEPFALNSSIPWTDDPRTRVMLFAMNLALSPGEDLSAITADAEDGEHHLFTLRVESLSPIPGQEWLSALALRLNDNLSNNGDVLVRVTYHGLNSNRVRVGIGQVGKGPPDDPGSAPTPAPPYIIKGQITMNGVGFGEGSVLLSGNQSDIVKTNSDGSYSFTLNQFGSYSVTPSVLFYKFSPQTIAFDFLTGSHTDANFTASRITYSISGQLKDVDSSSIASIPVTLAGNSKTQTVMTDAQGAYSFPEIEAGYSYTVTPASSNVFVFSAQGIPSLTSNLSVNFQATRRTYSISGKVLEGARPISGAAVSLSGWTAATAVTDADGSYLFQNLQAGRNYMVKPAKAYFDFVPQGQSVENIQSNQTINYKGTPTYNLTGRVTDEKGNGLGGMVMTLAGAERAVVQTASDGTYSIIAHATGDYTLTAFADQNYFTFSPATQNLPSVDGDRSVNFQGILSLTANPSYVLEYDGTPKTVDCGPFWPDIPLGHFFWEVWGQPGADAGATYMISDGYGGAHAILFGFAFYGANEPGRYELFGDVWDGSKVVYFSSDEGPAAGEWGHFGVGWDGHQIITYFNGVPVGRVPFSGPRWTPGWVGGGGRLLIGGSDHNNLVGHIAQVRGYEDRNPREDSSVAASFAPEAVFSRGGEYLGYFFRPSQAIADMSGYYRGQVHRGQLRGTLYPYGLLYECPGCPLPKFVADPAAPTFLNSPVNNSAPVTAGPSPPPGALIFDSFSRANSTYTLGKGGLGSTEAGSRRPQQWQASKTSTGLESFGILNGRAVLLANEMALAWIQTGSSSSNLDIQVNRHAGIWGSGFDTSIAFRVSDSRNFFFAYTSGDENDPASSRKLTVGYYLNGIRTNLVTNVSLEGSWTMLEIANKSNGQINVLIDGVSVYSVNSSILVNATGVGLYSNGPGLGLLNRWDNFTVHNTY